MTVSTRAFSLVVLHIVCNMLFICANEALANETILGSTRDAFTMHISHDVYPVHLHANETKDHGLNLGSTSDAEASVASMQPPHQDEPSFVHYKGRLHPQFKLPASEDEVLDEDHIRQVRAKFKSYEDIKSEFERLNLTIKTDLEIMDTLIHVLEQGLADETRYLVILEDLSYLLHQVDNGEYLVKKNGLRLIQPLLSHDSALVRKAALSCLSAAVQGNSVVKVSFLQSGLLDVLCSILSNSSTPSAPATEDSVKVLSAGLTVISVLLRDFPSAQRYFFSKENDGHSGLSGFDFLTGLFEYESSIPQFKHVANLRTRIVVLLSDIALERANALQQSLKEPTAKSLKLWELYSQIPFDQSLIHSGWCERAREFLVSEVEGFVREGVNAATNHGQLERVLFALRHLTPICGHQFASDVRANKALTYLEREYFDLSTVKESEHDLYFTDLHKLIINVRQVLKRTSISARTSDEL